MELINKFMWRKELPGIIRESRFFSEAVATENLELFIRDEIIEKLLEDMDRPTKFPGWNDPENMHEVNTAEFIQQLRAKWLERD